MLHVILRYTAICWLPEALGLHGRDVHGRNLVMPDPKMPKELTRLHGLENVHMLFPDPKKKKHLWKVLPLDDHGVQWLSTAKQVVDRAVVGMWSRGWGWFPKFDLQLEVRLVWAYPCPTWRFRMDVQTKVNQLLFDYLVVRGYAQEDTANQCHLSFIKLNRRNWRVCFLRVPPILGKKQHVELKILNLWEFLWIRVIRPQVVDFRWEWIFWCKSYR